MRSHPCSQPIVTYLLDALPDGLDAEEFWEQASLLIGNESELEIEEAWFEYRHNGWDFPYPGL